MATAVQVIWNGSYGRTVVRDMEAALTNVGDNLLGSRGDEGKLTLFLDEARLDLSDAGDVGLGYVVRKLAEDSGRESIQVVVHDLDCRPGMDGVRFEYDLVGERDPSYEILKAVLRSADGEAQDVIEADLLAAVKESTKRFAKPESVVMFFAAAKDFFAGAGPALSDEDLAGPPESVVRALPERAVERFRSVVADLSRAPAL